MSCKAAESIPYCYNCAAEGHLGYVSYSYVVLSTPLHTSLQKEEKVHNDCHKAAI